MTEDRLYQDPDLADFYDVENEWSGDQAYCRLLAADCGAVLDLGCGSGRLAAELAAGDDRRVVFGVDPAGPMLDIARSRPGGGRVTWVQSDGRTVRLDRRFDLVVLTGHAFQVFLTAGDQLAALQTIAAHMAPGGRFIFDSRDPTVREWQEWTPEASRRRIDHPRLGPVDAWNDVAEDPDTGIVTYGTHYRILADGRVLSAQSQIAFPPRAQLERLIAEAGLVVDTWLGDWTGQPWRPGARDFIPLGRLA